MRYRNKISGSIVRVKDGRKLSGRWEPCGEVVEEAKTDVVDEVVEEAKTDLSYDELKAKATSLGIAFKGNPKKTDLINLIKQVEQA